MRLKVGKKVRIIDDRGATGTKNKIGILKEDDRSWKPYKVYFEDIDDFFWFKEDQVELENKKPTKQELLDMPIGTKIYTDAEDKDYQVWVKTSKEDFNCNYDDYIDDNAINEDLTLDKDETDEAYGTKIIRMEKPTYETIYDHSTEVQEMTVAEIEEALGHAVKIIKEDN